MHIKLLLTVTTLIIPATGLALGEQKTTQWTEDIRYFLETLEDRHINLYHTMHKAELDRQLSGLIEQLPQLNRHEVMVEMMRITRRIDDGHTRFPAMGGPHTHYPFSLEWIDGSIRVLATTPAHKGLLGQELAAIDGVTTARVLETIDPLVQGAENIHSLRAGYRWHLNVAEVLYGAGITRDVRRARFVFHDDNSDEITVEAEAMPMDRFVAALKHRIAPDNRFLSKRIAAHSDSLWLAHDNALNTAYIYFAAYPDRHDMEPFAIDTAKHLVDRKAEHLIIDLRDNGGGDFFVGLMLAHALIGVDNLDWESGIYVLIGPKTYSAGMSNAAQYRGILNATLVGTPTGANPVGYQDADGFQLPHSGRHVMYSKRYYAFQDNPTQGVIPDHRVRTDWQSYRAGEDRVLQYTLKLITGE